MKPAILDQLCRRALAEELGVCVRTNYPKALREHLAAFQQGVPEFANLVVRSPPVPELVFIGKPSVELEP